MKFLMKATIGAALALAPNLAVAATVSVASDCGGFGETVTGSGDLFVSASGSITGCGGNAKATVGSGYLGAFANVSTSSSFVRGGRSQATASVSYQFLIATPTSYTGGDIDVQVRFGLDGSIGGSTDTNDTEDSLRQARIDATYQVNGFSSTNNGSDFRRTRREFLAEEYDSAGTVSFGPTTGSSIVSEVLSIDPRGGLTVNFTLEALANMVSQNNQVSVTANAFDTFGFASDGPAFILPEGFSISSQEAGIVNNYWIDPRSPTPQVVPLPASMPMLLAGLAGLLMIRRNTPNAKKLRQVTVSV